MTPLVQECSTPLTPELLLELIRQEPGVVLLRSGTFDEQHGRYSFVTARPFLSFRAFGCRCEIRTGPTPHWQFGDPWQILEQLLGRYEMLEELDLPFPLGGCFGYWGYELKNFTEPGLPQWSLDDLELPDCHLGFYSALVAFDHQLGKTWILSTGLAFDGSRREGVARSEAEFWHKQLKSPEPLGAPWAGARGSLPPAARLRSNLARSEFEDRVKRAQRYIRAGDIYQVNLAQRFTARPVPLGWELYQRLAEASPAPYGAYLDCGEFQIASSSPELFLRLNAARVITRPIKGTRARSADPTVDTQLSYELQTSAKELAELVMITDLLRNDLGKVCEYGSVQVPELARLERYAHVQHLVSTVEGSLRPGVSHLAALAACFPGGSITGAPKVRAMQIIDELEPMTRGPYTGALGYIGFNRESQLSILIRAAVVRDQTAWFHAGAGIVADSIAEAEYEETLAKAGGFFQALGRRPSPRTEPTRMEV
jgi:para-aminobenzoate synthetase component I